MMKQEHEVLNARTLVFEIERKSLDISPQQLAYLRGIRCGLSWALCLPSGGRKLEEIVSGMLLPAVVPPLIGDDFNTGRMR